MQIYIVDSEGKEEVRRLIPDQEFPGNAPTWSHDGKWIAFQSARDGNTEIYTAPVDGGEPIRLTDDPEWDGDPTWSPDGEMILFSSTRAEEDGGRSELYLMDGEGGNLERLTHNENWEGESTWSTDGSTILFAMDAGRGARGR